jgi:adenine phosphoribosyltransferase
MTTAHSSADELALLVRSRLRDVPDFPKPGILFRDITPLLADAAAFRAVCDAMAGPFLGSAVTHVAAIESRGFILGAPVADRLGAGLVPIRKPGKLPARTERVQYALEYGVDALEIHADAVGEGDRVLVVDDVLATGGTASAATRLLSQVGSEVVACSFLLSLDFLRGHEALTVPWRSIVSL